MGVVWAAEDVVAHGPVALKFLQDGAADPDAAKRLLREARAVSAVRHPHVVQTLEALELEDGSPVLVMELLTGESLRELLQGAPRLALRELAEILAASGCVRHAAACANRARGGRGRKKAGGTGKARGPIRAIPRTESPQLGLSRRRRTD
jgi:protein tyrosine kinase